MRNECIANSLADISIIILSTLNVCYETDRERSSIACMRYLVTVPFVAAVSAVRVRVADVRGVQAHGGVALELAGAAREGGARGRLVAAVTAVVLRVAAPPERDALERGRTHEVRCCTVVRARAPVWLEDPVLGAGAAGARLPPGRGRRKQAQSGAVKPRAEIGGSRRGGLARRVVHTQVHGLVHGGEQRAALERAAPRRLGAGGRLRVEMARPTATGLHSARLPV